MIYKKFVATESEHPEQRRKYLFYFFRKLGFSTEMCNRKINKYICKRSFYPTWPSLVGQRTVDPRIAGSNPAVGTFYSKIFKLIFHISLMVEPHRHCLVCGKAIPADKNFCSEKCERYYEKKIKTQKRYFYILMALPIILILLLFILGGVQ